MRRICRSLILVLTLCGCATSRKVPSFSSTKAEPAESLQVASRVESEQAESDTSSETLSDAFMDDSDETELQLAGFLTEVETDESGTEEVGTDLQSSTESSALQVKITAEEAGIASNVANRPADKIQFDEVVGAVYQSYPLLESALFSRNIALGQQIGASGAFDTKLKAASENGPQGFYQTYRQNVGVVQPTYWGGEFFAGYRIGRGDFQPWYLERQTNDAGEFKAGVQVPLARNRTIDARRAELWKAGFGRNLVEPEIQAQLIEFVQMGSYSYWDWVAAGEYYSIAKRILVLAEDRTSRIEAQVKAGLIDPPELTDNLRLVAIRQAKVADTRRKLEQTAAKLSIYLRDADGTPILATEEQLPGFPEIIPLDDLTLDTNIELALGQRPELRVLDLVRRQTQVDYAEAVNQLQPELNAVIWGSQDVGEPTSSKRDKSPYESEASLYFDLPLQRRKARGKMTELQGKLAQISAKRRITADKISAEIRSAHAAVKSAWEQVESTRAALEYAEDLAARERRNQELGTSDLLKVALREQYAVESAEKNIDALKLYFESQADYRAALAQDRLNLGQ